ncbi:MAG: hypothetical protein M1828_006510 [Chrysothrix sp. TS-e1954]|nr:MAG: hypothetical protein M1828_006510 [Chrysothrix sp. TS-e1954]
MPNDDPNSPNPLPFSEPPFLSGLPSPYYNDSHRKWQRDCRAFVATNLNEHAYEWEQAEQVPDHVYTTFSKAGMLIPALGAPLPLQELRALGMTELLGGLKIEEFDYFHASIYFYEMAHSGISGPSTSLTVGFAFGVPPLLKFGSPSLKSTFLPDLLTGRRRICIAITEPDAGSDVANISTTATKTPDGTHYLVSGMKKWITNGIFSDYASMAVRTGPPDSGAAGLSMLLVPLKAPGVDMRRLRVSGGSAAGTTFMELEDVRVPVANLIGSEGQGMRYVMTNFNHERLVVAIQTAAQCRAVLSASLEYVLARRAFGRELIEQPLVRHRLAVAGASLESLSTWIDHLTYCMKTLGSKDEADRKLGGLTAMAKARAGIVLRDCAETASLLFGGKGQTREGAGEIAERAWREVMGARVPGGSEDVMWDLGVRELVKGFRRRAKEVREGRAAKL